MSINIKHFLKINQNGLYLGLIILIGAILRLYNLGTENLWFDEVITVHRVSQDLRTLVYELTTQGSIIRNAVYYLLAHFWLLPFGATETSIRLLSVICGVLSIGMMYVVGEKLFGSTVGLISSFLMAVSIFQIKHSQEARFYSLFVLATLISFYFYILAIKTRRPYLWIISSLVNIFLFYTHTYAVFVIGAQYAHYFIYWKNNKNSLVQWGMSQLLLFLAVIVGIISMLQVENSVAELAGGLEWIAVPAFKDLFRTVYGYLFPVHYQHSWAFIGFSFLAGLVFLVTGALLFNLQELKNHGLSKLSKWIVDIKYFDQPGEGLVLTSIWFLFPVALPFIYSQILPPAFIDRYTICAAPALYLLVAVAMSRISRVIPVYISIGALMIVILPGLRDYYVSDINEQWQEAASFVMKNSSPADILVFAPDAEGYQGKSFDWYYQGNLPHCGISPQTTDDVSMEAALSNCILGHQRFWVIMRGPSNVVDPMKSFLLAPKNDGFRLMNESHFIGVSVYLFENEK